jgi:hypothetical protein
MVIGDMEQFVSPELVGQLDSKVAFIEGAVAVRMPGSVLIRRSEFDRVGNSRPGSSPARVLGLGLARRGARR